MYSEPQNAHLKLYFLFNLAFLIAWKNLFFFFFFFYKFTIANLDYNDYVLLLAWTNFSIDI